MILSSHDPRISHKAAGSVTFAQNTRGARAQGAPYGKRFQTPTHARARPARSSMWGPSDRSITLYGVTRAPTRCAIASSGRHASQRRYARSIELIDGGTLRFQAGYLGDA